MISDRACARVHGVKRILLWFVAIISGLYLLLLGPILDPLPFLDEAAALAVFAFAMRALGYDVVRWIPFVRQIRGGLKGRQGDRQPPPPPNARTHPKAAARGASPVIDV